MTTPAVREQNPAQQLVAEVRRPDFREQIALALPENMNADRFTRALVTALLENQDLVKADRGSLFQATIKCAQDGLLPDGREAALVVFGGKVAYLPMVGGFRKIAGEYGWVIRSAVVYARDHFRVELGADERLEHRPVALGEDRGEIIGAYAVGVARDGRREFEVLNRDDLEKVRKSSRASGRGPWVDWTERMYEKTAARRLFKKLPLDPADQRIVRVIQAADLEPGDAAAQLYGREPVREVGPGPSVTGQLVDRVGADGGQQAEPEPRPEDPLDGSGSAPGPDPDEIPFGDDATGEPSEDDIPAATEAAGFVVRVTKDVWVNGLTLAQVNADERGEAFFRWALGELREGPLKTAAVAYAKVRLPGLLAESAQ